MPTSHFLMENAFLPIFDPIFPINRLKIKETYSFLYGMLLSNKTKTYEHVYVGERTTFPWTIFPREILSVVREIWFKVE